MTTKYTDQTTASKLVTEYTSLIKGKTILTTGTSPSSLGANYVEALQAAHPKLIILTGRSPTKLEAEATRITACPTRILPLDLTSFKDVRRAAEEMNSWEDVENIDVVCCSAGVMAVEYGVTEDGFETQFTSNHLGHFLFVNLIMGKILRSDAPRVVMVSSDGHRLSHIRWDDINYNGGKTYNKWSAYGQAKTANMLFAISLAKKLGSRGLLSFSLHPGVILSTSLGSHVEDFETLGEYDRMMGHPGGFAEEGKQFKPVTPEQGVATQVFASFEPTLKNHNGTYLIECRLADPYKDIVKPWATSEIEADRLWTLSEEAVGQRFKY